MCKKLHVIRMYLLFIIKTFLTSLSHVLQRGTFFVCIILGVLGISIVSLVIVVQITKLINSNH